MERAISKKWFVWVLMVATIIICTVPVQAVSISYKRLELFAGEKSYDLFVSGTRKKVTWSSSNSKIVSINKAGTVTAKKVGKAVITAKVGKTKYKCTVKVYPWSRDLADLVIELYHECEMADQGGYTYWHYWKKDSNYYYYKLRYGTGATRTVRLAKKTGYVYGGPYYMFSEKLSNYSGYKKMFHATKYWIDG